MELHERLSAKRPDDARGDRDPFAEIKNRIHLALVDGDLQFGDVGLALGLAPERTIYNLATSGGSVDAETIGE